MMNGSSTHFVLSAGYGSGGGSSSGGYNRGRSDHQSSDDRGSGGYSRGRNDHQSSEDRGSGGYSRGRSDNNDDYGGGGGGYNRGRSDYHSSNGGGGGGGDDNRMETQRDTIFIQNLPRSVTADELNEVFRQIGMIKVGYYFSIDSNRTCIFLFDRMIKRRVHQKFGFIKTKQPEKVKVKQQLLMMMKKPHKLLSIGIMVKLF